jgi:glycosyltransferase involved in cell wall biosynthesis
MGLILKLLTGLPWIAFIHGETTEGRKLRFYNALEFHLIRYANKVVTVSDAMKQSLVMRGFPEQKVVAIRNAIDPTEYTVSADRKVLRRKYGLDSDDCVLSVFGRFSEEKGQLVSFRRSACCVTHNQSAPS